MADKKVVKKTMDDKAVKDAIKATLQSQVKAQAPKPQEKAIKAEAKPVSVVKTEAPKAEVKEPAKVAAETPKPQEKAIKAEAKPVSVVKTEAPKAEVKEPAKVAAETPEIEAEAEGKKEADPNKVFVDGIMAEMDIKGASKKRLVKKLGEKYNFDKQKVMFKLKRALISERYAAVSGH